MSQQLICQHSRLKARKLTIAVPSLRINCHSANSMTFKDCEGSFFARFYCQIDPIGCLRAKRVHLFAQQPLQTMHTVISATFLSHTCAPVPTDGISLGNKLCVTSPYRLIFAGTILVTPTIDGFEKSVGNHDRGPFPLPQVRSERGPGGGFFLQGRWDHPASSRECS